LAAQLRSEGTGAEASSFISVAGTPAILIVALTHEKHLSTNLSINHLCLSSAHSYLTEKVGASGNSVWYEAVARGPVREADARVCPQRAAEKDVARSEISADGQATSPAVTAIMVI